MKRNFTKLACGLLLLVAAAGVHAQSTWNYFISDAGGGNSLVTWNVTGNLAAAPGVTILTAEPDITIPIVSPGIFNDSYPATGTPQAIPAPDGSTFQFGGEVEAPIFSFYTYNAPDDGNDIFELESAALPPHLGGPGTQFYDIPGTQSALIPVDYSAFNPGTYQSEDAEFGTAITVNLIVGPVPEPSTLALFAMSGVCSLLLLRRRK